MLLQIKRILKKVLPPAAVRWIQRTQRKFERTSEDNIVNNFGERQAKSRLDQIESSHVARYRFAKSYVKSGDKILDLACGVGYGAYIIANHKSVHIDAVDISEKAIDYGRKYYSHQDIRYMVGDGLRISCPGPTYDSIFSFETFEHIENPKILLENFNKLLKPGGFLFVSTPNQTVTPFDAKKFPYHVRHYDLSEVTTIVNACGFSIKEIFGQIETSIFKDSSGKRGKFLILHAEKSLVKKDTSIYTVRSKQ